MWAKRTYVRFKAINRVRSPQSFVPATKGGLAQIAGRAMAEDGDHGWVRVVRDGVELHTVLGDHFSVMLGDGGKQIARELSLSLNEAITLPK